MVFSYLQLNCTRNLGFVHRFVPCIVDDAQQIDTTPGVSYADKDYRLHLNLSFISFNGVPYYA